MNVPLTLIVIAGVIWLLPSTRKRVRKPLQLDPIGVLIFGVMILALMWPFLFTTGSPTDNPQRWWLLAVFAVFAALFVWWEQRYAASGKKPLIPFKLFAISSYRNGTLIQAVYFMALPAMFLLTTLFLQIGMGVEPVFAGMVSIGFAVASAISSYIGGTVVTKIGRPLVVWGLVIVLASVAGLAIVAYTLPAGIVEIGMAAVLTIAGIGGGLVISPNQTLTLAEIPVKQGGLAGSVGQLGQRIGTAVGTAVALSLFYATVFRETDGEAPDLAVYHDAYSLGMMAVGLFVGIALLVGVVDVSARRRRAKHR